MTPRRDFLRTITLASGAVFLGIPAGCAGRADVRRFSAGAQQFMRAHALVRDGLTMAVPSKISSAQVCVIGSGFSGTTAAWLLAQKGIECTLLESEDVVGGCARVYRPKEFTPGVPLGNVYFIERSETLDAMTSATKTLVEPCPDDIYLLGDEVLYDFWSDVDISRIATSLADADGLMRFRDDVLAMSDAQLPTYPLRAASQNLLERYDKQTALDFIRPYKSPTLELVLDAYARSSMGAGLADINTYCLLNFYVDEFGASFDKGRWIVRGGTSDLLTAVAATLPDVRTDRMAYRLEQRVGGWSVFAAGSNGETERIDAEHVIMCSPLFASRALLRNSGLQQAEAIPRLQYAPYMTVHMHSSEPLTVAGSYDTWHLPAGERYTDLISPLGGAVPLSKGEEWTSAYSPMPTKVRGQLMDESSVALLANKTADAVLQRLGKPAELIDGIFAWSWGHGVVIPTIGSHTAVANVASAMPDGIHLACTDVDAAPSIENAILAAEYAVASIIG